MDAETIQGTVRGMDASESLRVRQRAALLRKHDAAFARWAQGHGPVQHDDRTQVRVSELADVLVRRGDVASRGQAFEVLRAADLVASAGMWLVAHMSYARRVRLDGEELAPEDFKDHPQGHMGGALNMVPAYTGYLAANTLTGVTRSWLMGQGHCVAAVDAVNAVTGNLGAGHAARGYGLTDEGLTRLVQDFYSFAVRPDGRPGTPLGSHVNAHTAGSTQEGGYLGFAELTYAHMPLPGERLVVFLSDGAFEEQRGSDWVPRWWRASDSGLVIPVMIANGRRIDQRTTSAMTGGVPWLRDHLRLNGFDPFDVDGRDPAAFVWAILEMEDRLTAWGEAVRQGDGHARYPVPIPYAIAEAPKGYGFPGAGTNASHNLPLGSDLRGDAEARRRFHEGARRLHVPGAALRSAVRALNDHEARHRPWERDHPLARRDPPEPDMPEPAWSDPARGGEASPMRALDAHFVELVEANPRLRPRVGNPDEASSNRLQRTLERLKHRVTSPEEGAPEALDGAIITALNEEAVVCAALGNKGGINLVATYEAFAVKMLGAVRQELIFARNQREAGAPPRWLGVPLLLTSHTWENGKNEHSHQDPTMVEALMGEMSDGARVVFPVDANSALACLRACYRSRGQVWAVVAPKNAVPDALSREQAEAAVRDGAVVVRGELAEAEVLLVAVGAYQLTEALRAAGRLEARGMRPAVVALVEPGRFRVPRDAEEGLHTAKADLRDRLFPPAVQARVLVTHTRPEPLMGVVRPLDTGPQRCRALGYVNRGGTFDVPAMLFANRCTWAHVVQAAGEAAGRDPQDLLEADELAAVRGQGDPAPLLGR